MANVYGTALCFLSLFLSSTAGAALLQEKDAVPLQQQHPGTTQPPAGASSSSAFKNFYQQPKNAEQAITPAADISGLRPLPTPALAEPQQPLPPPPPSKHEMAFGALLDSALPLSPDQIKQLHHLYDLTQQAVSAAPTLPPTPVSSSLAVTLEPGSTPPLVRLSAGFVSSLVFVDSTGAPWPITAYGLGDPSSFNVQWDQTSNALFIQSLKPYAHGNLAVRLASLNTPVMISLVSGQKEIDYRVDLQIRDRGPNAEAPIVPESLQLGAQVDPRLINVLDGVAPQHSKQLILIPNIGQAWLTKENTLYLRTTLTLLSPAWTATISSPNGTHVYEMSKTPLVLASQDGKTITVEIQGL
jgi:intracellular multiplication protein IcmK